MESLRQSLLSAFNSASEFAPSLSWQLATELARGAVLLLILALAVRAAAGVRARYRLISVGLGLALALPISAAALGVWTINLPAGWAFANPQAITERATAEAAITTDHTRMQEGRVTPHWEQRALLADRLDYERSAVDAAVAIDLLARVQPDAERALTTTADLRASLLQRSRDDDSRGALAGIVAAAPEAGTVAELATIADTIPMAVNEAPLSLANAMEKTEGWTQTIADVAVAAVNQPLTWLVLWGLGALAVLLSGAMGLARLAYLAAGSTPADDRWRLEAFRVAGRLGIRRSVRVVVSPEVPVPLTWGVLRPVVMIPSAATSWNAERRRVVLTHELVHVRRLDWAVQLLGWAVLALHWCNPLAWWAVRRLAVERERSCDAAVVAAGTRPSTYAAHLLDIARALSSARSPVHALGMAKASELEGRLMHILNQPRRGARRSLAAAILVGCAGLATAAVAVSPSVDSVPPEQLEELERREAELARMEAELADRRAMLELQRAEIAAAEALEAAEAISAESVPQGSRSRAVAEVEAARNVLRAQEREVRQAESILRKKEAIEAKGRLIVERENIAQGEPVQPYAELIIQSIRSDGHSYPALARWAELADKPAALREVLAKYRVIERPEILQLHERLNAYSTELQTIGQHLEGVAIKLQPNHEHLEKYHAKLQPLQEQLQTLHVQLEQEMASLELEMDRELAKVESAQNVAIDLESAMKDQYIALARQIELAAKNNDAEGVQAAEAELRKLSEHRTNAARMNAQQHRDQVAVIRENLMAKRQDLVLKRDILIGDLHAEMDRLHAEMDTIHKDSDGVHKQMDGVHKEMDQVHKKLDATHQAIEAELRKVIEEIVRDVLKEQGINPDSPKSEKVISAVTTTGGNRLVFTIAGGEEIVQVIDIEDRERRIKDALAELEDRGEVRFDGPAAEKLNRVIKEVTERANVLRFRARNIREDVLLEEVRAEPIEAVNRPALVEVTTAESIPAGQVMVVSPAEVVSIETTEPVEPMVIEAISIPAEVSLNEIVIETENIPTTEPVIEVTDIPADEI